MFQVKNQSEPTDLKIEKITSACKITTVDYDGDERIFPIDV
jgi:hypothetical protein